MLRQNPARPTAATPWVRVVLAVVLGLLTLYGLRGSGVWLRLTELRYFLLPAAAAAGLGLWFRRTRPPPRARLAVLAPLLILAGTLTLYLASNSAACEHWSYFLNWTEGPLLRRGLVRFVFWTALLTPLFVLRLHRLWLAVFILLVVTQWSCVASLLDFTGGRALYRTDHPSFLFRLWQFSEAFPQLVSYVPHWNGGVVDTAPLTSGTAGPGLLLWPLWQARLPHAVYTPALLALFVVLVPWMAVWAVRAAGGDRLAAGVGGVLALGLSQSFFLWTLHFGTIGAGLASAMALPVAAFAFRATWLRRREPWLAAGLILSGFLLLLWPAAGVVAVVMAVALPWLGPRLTSAPWRTWVFLGVCGFILFLGFFPFLHAILTAGRDVVDFVSKNHSAAAPRQGGWMTLVTRGADSLFGYAREAHPLVLFLGLLGAAVSPRRGIRRWFLPVLLGLMAVVVWTRAYTPESQLWRMAIPMMFIAVAPAALHFSRLVRIPDPRLAPLRAGLCVLLALGAHDIARDYDNRGPAPIEAMPAELDAFTHWVRVNVPKGGRLLFFGSCGRTFGGGYAAYLPALTGREMMARDYYNFPPGFGPAQYPPEAARANDRRLRAFLDAYNVTHAATHLDDERAFLEQRPDLFQPVGSMLQYGRTVHCYRVQRTPTPLHGASGRVEAGFNRLDVRLDAPADEVVLPYNWVEGLRAAPPVQLVPSERPGGIRLIGVHTGGRQEFTITYRYQPRKKEAKP